MLVLVVEALLVAAGVVAVALEEPLDVPVFCALD